MSGYNVIQLTAKANESLLSKYANWDENGGASRFRGNSYMKSICYQFVVFNLEDKVVF